MSKCRPSSLDLDACSCCLSVAKSSPVLRSPTLAHLWDKLLVAGRLESILAQPEPLNGQRPKQQQQQPSSPPSTPLLKILRDPRLLAASGLGSQPGEQTLLAILLFFHSASGASVVAIDNKIEQAMDLVKSHLMYAVREEVEVLKEQIKELIEKNSQLEQENRLLKSLASPEQLQQIQSQIVSVPSGGGGAQPSTPGGGTPAVCAVAAPPAAAAPVTTAPTATALPSV